METSILGDPALVESGPDAPGDRPASSRKPDGPPLQPLRDILLNDVELVICVLLQAWITGVSVVIPGIREAICTTLGKTDFASHTDNSIARLVR
jgi:hypothetical protein